MVWEKNTQSELNKLRFYLLKVRMKNVDIWNKSLWYYYTMLCCAVLCVLCTHCEKSIYGSRRHHVQLQCYYSCELFVTFPIYAFLNDELKIWNLLNEWYSLLNERREHFNVYLCFGLNLSFAWSISALPYYISVLRHSYPTSSVLHYFCVNLSSCSISG